MKLYFYILLFGYGAAAYSAAGTSGGYVPPSTCPFPFIRVDSPSKNIYIPGIKTNEHDSRMIDHSWGILYATNFIDESQLHNERLIQETYNRGFRLDWLQEDQWEGENYEVIKLPFTYMEDRYPRSDSKSVEITTDHLQNPPIDALRAYCEGRYGYQLNASPLLPQVASYFERFPTMQFLQLYKIYADSRFSNHLTNYQNFIYPKRLQEAVMSEQPPLRLLADLPAFPTQCVRSKKSQEFLSCLRPLNYLNSCDREYPRDNSPFEPTASGLYRIICMEDYDVSLDDLNSIAGQGNLFIINNGIPTQDTPTLEPDAILAINERLRSSCSWPRFCIDKLYAARYHLAFVNAAFYTFIRGLASQRNKKTAASLLDQLDADRTGLLLTGILTPAKNILSAMACTYLASVCIEYFFGYRAYQPSKVIVPEIHSCKISRKRTHEILDTYTPDLNPETENWYKQNQRIAATVGITATTFAASCYYLSRTKSSI